MNIGQLTRRLLIEQKSVTRDSGFGSEVITWVPLATVWCSALDVLNPKNGGDERIKEGVRTLTRPCRVLIRYRADVTTDMRVTLVDRSRVMQITSMAEIGRAEALELMCEEYSI